MKAKPSIAKKNTSQRVSFPLLSTSDSNKPLLSLPLLTFSDYQLLQEAWHDVLEATIGGLKAGGGR